MADRYQLAFVKNALSVTGANPQEQGSLEAELCKRLLTAGLTVSAAGVISTTQPVSGATAWISVKDTPYGAVGDGVTNDTAAIIAANAACQALRVTSVTGGGITTGASPTLFFPRGVYVVSADLANGVAQHYLRWIGDDAILVCAAGITCLSKVGFGLSWEGITVRGGATAISIATGNVDTDLITLRRCQFVEQTAATLIVDNNSASTQLLVDDCKFYVDTPAGRVLTAQSGTAIAFTNCWVTCANATTAAFVVTDVGLRLEGLLGVPGGLLAWVDVSGVSTVRATRCRFGGEGGGTTDAIVINRMTMDTAYPVIPSVVSLTNCAVFSAGAVVHCYALPNVIELRQNTGFTDTRPLHLESTISAADLAGIGSQNHRVVIAENVVPYRPFIDYTSAPSALAANGVPLLDHRTIDSARPTTASLVLQTQVNTGSYGVTLTFTNVTGPTTPVDDLGVSGRYITATADNANCNIVFTSMLSGLAAGVYTAVFDVDNLGTVPIWPIVTAANVEHREHVLAPGAHLVSVPFYYDGGAVQTVRFGAPGLWNGALFRVNRIRIYTGQRRIMTKYAEVIGTVAPVAGQWYPNDTCWNSAPAGGAALSWTCTVAGTPGTWVGLTLS